MPAASPTRSAGALRLVLLALTGWPLWAGCGPSPVASTPPLIEQAALADDSAAAPRTDVDSAEEAGAAADAPAARPPTDEAAPPADHPSADSPVADDLPTEPAADADAPDPDVIGPRDEEADLLEHPFPKRIRAPALDGGPRAEWINTAGPITLSDLRGKFVLLDFWTYCCINCMHVLPELKKLEQAYPNELVVIGVHSAKFDAEQDAANIREAVLRYDIEHPVVNDPDHVIWDSYFAESWPSLRVIDPEGYLVAGDHGEIDFETLDGFFKQALGYYRRKGVLDQTPVRFDLEAYRSLPTPLRFPGKVLADEAGQRLFIADSNHNRIVVSRLDPAAPELLDVIGSGAVGRQDGDCATAEFNKPQGLALHGNTLYVADTENQVLRKVDLVARQVTTIAGTGRQGRGLNWPGLDRAAIQLGVLPDRFAGPPLNTSLNSPWDVLVHDGVLYVAMAGTHQIWRMPLDESEIEVDAGNGKEDIVDGPLAPRVPFEEGYCSLAQPSGLATDGTWLYVADSEGSSVRAVPLDPQQEVRTLVGTARLRHGRLFAFGDIDGTGEQVRLQHPLAVAHVEGRLYVADTYNNKIKVIDLAGPTCTTLVGTGQPGAADEPPQFDEPAGLSYAAGKLYVADTNNHRVRVIHLDEGHRVTTLEIAGLEPPPEPQPQSPDDSDGGQKIALEPQTVEPSEGAVRLAVRLRLPQGYKINPLAPMSYRVSAEGSGPVDRKALGTTRLEQPAAEFLAALPLAAAEGEDTVRLALTYYYCQEGGEGLCKVGRVTWTVPLRLVADGPPEVPLELEVK